MRIAIIGRSTIVNKVDIGGWPWPTGHRIVPRPIDAGMDLRLGRARRVAVENLAGEIDDQNVIGADAGAACVARRDQETIGAGQTRADMAAVIKQLGHDHHARACDKLFAQFGFTY